MVEKIFPEFQEFLLSRKLVTEEYIPASRSVGMFITFERKHEAVFKGASEKGLPFRNGTVRDWGQVCIHAYRHAAQHEEWLSPIIWILKS